MPPSDTPMNTAHQHAANADDYIAKGLIELAAEEHRLAGEAYLAAIERSNDESAKRTLRRLYNEHCKASKELLRRVEQLKAEGKDPSQPQKPDTFNKAPAFRHNSSTQIAGPSRINNASPQPMRPMSDSQHTPEESFMLLGGQRSDPGDAFNQFWNIMQGMLDNLSQPVAFATAPLGIPDAPNAQSADSTTAGATASDDARGRDGASSSDTDADEPIFSRFTRKIGISRDLGAKSGRSSRTNSAAPSRNHSFEENDDFEDFLDAGDDLSGSFFVIPTGPEASPAVLKKENETLKAEVASMKSRLEATERVLKLRKEQDLQLRDSIVLATREAQRAMGAPPAGGQQRPGPPLDFSSLNLNVPAVPIPGINTGREAQYARRIKELEDELRLMRVENEKNKLMIAKFRERWEKLKDSAKRKKEAKAAAEVAATGVRDAIVEEPEAEEELDEPNKR